MQSMAAAVAAAVTRYGVRAVEMGANPSMPATAGFVGSVVCRPVLFRAEVGLRAEVVQVAAAPVHAARCVSVFTEEFEPCV